MENTPPELTQDDYIAGATVFASALSRMLNVGEGILIKPEGKFAKHFSPDNELLLIANDGTKITVAPLSDFIDDTSDFEDGMIVEITQHNENKQENE